MHITMNQVIWHQCFVLSFIDTQDLNGSIENQFQKSQKLIMCKQIKTVTLWKYFSAGLLRNIIV